MAVNKKKEVDQKNASASLQNLAKLLGIPPKRGWKLAISNFFGVSQSLRAQWVDRGNIPDEWREFAVNKGYPLDKWFREEIKYPDIPAIGSEGADTRDPTELPYSLEEDRLDNIAPSMVHFQVKAEHHGTMVKVHEVLEGGEPQTTKALINNVDVFHEKIVEKRELTKQLKKQARALQELKWETRKRDKTVAVMREELDGLLGKRDAIKK